MMENFQSIRERIPDEAAGWLPHLAGGCSLSRLQRARTFFSDPAHSPAGTENELAKVVETVISCAGLREREGPAVSRYLRESEAGD
jgi:hypothetical protein